MQREATYRSRIRDFIQMAQRLANCRTPSELARKAGVSHTSLTRFMKRPETADMPSAMTLFKIADAAGLPSPLLDNVLILARRGDFETVPVVGVVRAGHWIENMQIPQEEWAVVTVPRSKNNAKERFGLVIEDDSADLEFPRGTIVICVGIDDDLQPQDGNYVVVLNERAGLVEVTVRRYTVESNGTVVLRSCSSVPRHQTDLKFQDRQGRRLSPHLSLAGIVDADYRPRL